MAEPREGKKVLQFDLPLLVAGAQADYVIFVQGARAADARMRIEMSADQLEAGPVIEEESTRIYAEEPGPPSPPPPGLPGSPPVPPIRDTSRTAAYQP